MDPYNHATSAAARPLDIAAPAADPLESTINTAIQRVEALREVVKARDAVKRAQLVLQAAEAEAAKLGAYSILPEKFRPGVAS